MPERVRIILVTDGDKVAQKVVESIAIELGLRCISASAGNPTPISGAEVVKLLKTVEHDPVLVMFDDRGRYDKGNGELALEYVASHPDIEVLGAIAVASNTTGIEGVQADVCITKRGQLINSSVDKNGDIKQESIENLTICGDTVDVLNDVGVPFIVGIGDIGKMDSADDLFKGAPITKKAVEEILKRSGIAWQKNKQQFQQI